MKVWDSFSQAAFLALVVISSIALMVGGIGVMAIMMISVTERTREIGVRKALGARRREILWQFLIEAAFLTSFGGVLGIILGAGIGLADPLALGLPDLAPLVVVRHRRRILRQRRHLLRPLPRHQGLTPGSDRSVAVRVASSFQLPASALSWAASLRCRPTFRRTAMQDYRESGRVAEGAPIDVRRVCCFCHIRSSTLTTHFRTRCRRAAISIPSNLAEGAGANRDPDFRRFLFASPWAPPMNLSIICFLRGTSGWPGRDLRPALERRGRNQTDARWPDRQAQREARTDGWS